MQEDLINFKKTIQNQVAQFCLDNFIKPARINFNINIETKDFNISINEDKEF